MAGRRDIGDDEPIVDINITPFVDIVLVLLVIFMVTTQFIVNKGINLQLPKAATAQQLQNQKTFNLAIDKNSKYMLDGREVNLEQLKLTAKQALESKQKIVVMISADKGVIYNSVIVVMDALRSQGVADFALQLDPATSQL